MFETRLNSKDDITRFIKLLMDNQISLEQKVASEDSEDIVDTAMLDYSGRFSAEDLEVLRKAFDGEKIEIGENYINVLLPEYLHEEAGWK